jgi:hypothetical protein
VGGTFTSLFSTCDRGFFSSIWAKATFAFWKGRWLRLRKYDPPIEYAEHFVFIQNGKQGDSKSLADANQAAMLDAASSGQQK